MSWGAGMVMKNKLVFLKPKSVLLLDGTGYYYGARIRYEKSLVIMSMHNI